MTKQSKFFRVAVEGATCDGREISRQDIVDIVETYNRETYGARVNMEHIRGFSDKPPFNAYGDVLAVKSEEFEMELGGKKVKKLALLAQIEPTDDLITLNGKSQKIYSSIEINPNFAETKRAYLQGLAVTDSPASLGTEILAFAATQGDKNPFASRKVAPGNFFSAATETKLEFEDAAPAQQTEAQNFFAAALDALKNFGKKEDKVEETVVPPKEPANDNVALAALVSSIDNMAKGIAAQGKDFTSAIASLRSDHDTLKASIETTDGDRTRRAPASGGNTAYAKSDF